MLIIQGSVPINKSILLLQWQQKKNTIYPQSFNMQKVVRCHNLLLFSRTLERGRLCVCKH